MIDFVKREVPAAIEQDNFEFTIDALQTLDAKALSFVQLQRLKSALNCAIDAATTESAQRVSEDSDGDTVELIAPPAAD